MNITALKGFKDILPAEAVLWQRIETTARDVFRRFGFREMKVPILEKTALFARSIGETTDIVEKEMYSFVDRNGESLTMRPEGTASVLRAFKTKMNKNICFFLLKGGFSLKTIFVLILLN